MKQNTAMSWSLLVSLFYSSLLFRSMFYLSFLCPDQELLSFFCFSFRLTRLPHYLFPKVCVSLEIYNFYVLPFQEKKEREK